MEAARSQAPVTDKPANLSSKDEQQQDEQQDEILPTDDAQQVSPAIEPEQDPVPTGRPQESMVDDAGGVT
jgi:hypothetical protein